MQGGVEKGSVVAVLFAAVVLGRWCVSPAPQGGDSDAAGYAAPAGVAPAQQKLQRAMFSWLIMQGGDGKGQCGGGVVHGIGAGSHFLVMGFAFVYVLPFTLSLLYLLPRFCSHRPNPI